MSDSDYQAPIEAPDDEPELSLREIQLRDKFVKEYLQDYNPLAAAIRIGYPKGYAREMAVRLMEEPYVVRKIQQLEQTPEEEDPIVIKKRIHASLMREAHYHGPGASQAARVAALAKLAQMHGMDAPTRTQTELTGADGQPLLSGTFVVPGVMTTEDWEKAAEEQQQKLTAPDSPPPTLQ